MSQIIAIHSSRGGTGKSSISANLASLLAVSGYRVALVDAHEQSGGIDQIFGLKTRDMQYTLEDYLRGECSIEEVPVPIEPDEDSAPGRRQLIGQDLFLVHSSHDIGGPSMGHEASYDIENLGEAFAELQDSLNLDYMLIDTHHRMGENTLHAMAIADTLLVILRPDQQDFQGTAVTVDIARILEVSELFLIVNKALLKKYDRKSVRKSVAEAFDAPVIGIMPLSESVADVGSDDLFSLSEPDHVWSKVMRDVADTVAAGKVVGAEN